MKAVGNLASLLLVSLLAVTMTAAASAFYVGDEDATNVEQTLFSTLDTVAPPIVVTLVFVLFVAFVGSIALVAYRAVTPANSRGVRR